jgi:hypothetical protein
MSLDAGMTSQKATKTCATIVTAEESNVKHTTARHTFTLAATLFTTPGGYDCLAA